MKIYWQGEVMLLNWSETSTRGRTVTFLLPEDDEHHPFRAATVKDGKRAGQRFAIVLVQVGDDEREVGPSPSQTAAILCKDPQFWRWADERSFMDVKSEAQARQFILDQIGIKSRSELDSSPPMHAKFLDQILNPFNEYRSNINRGML